MKSKAACRTNQARQRERIAGPSFGPAAILPGSRSQSADRYRTQARPHTRTHTRTRTQAQTRTRTGAHSARHADAYAHIVAISVYMRDVQTKGRSHNSEKAQLCFGAFTALFCEKTQLCFGDFWQLCFGQKSQLYFGFTAGKEKQWLIESRPSEPDAMPYLTGSPIWAKETMPIL